MLYHDDSQSDCDCGCAVVAMVGCDDDTLCGRDGRVHGGGLHGSLVVGCMLGLWLDAS